MALLVNKASCLAYLIVFIDKWKIEKSQKKFNNDSAWGIYIYWSTDIASSVSLGSSSSLGPYRRT